jgi:hypothetical protein
VTTAVVGPAGFWRRYVAWTLDAALLAPPLLAINWNGLVRGGTALRDAADAMLVELATRLLQMAGSAGSLQAIASDPRLVERAQALQWLAWEALRPLLGWSLAVAALYWIGFEGSRWQATPGKRALGLLVVDRAGRRMGYARAAGRHAGGALSWLTLNLGHLWAAVAPAHRALHDRLAGTSVLARDPRAPLPGFARAWLGVQLLAAVAAGLGWMAWSMAVVERAVQQAG